MSTPIEGYDEIVAFGHVLADAGDYSAQDLLAYFEKPHKWEKEYQRWRVLGGTLDKEVLEQMRFELEAG